MTIANIPDFRVTLDGRDLTGTIRPRLISLGITEKRGDEADQLDIVLNDSDGRLELPPAGAVLTVQLGWKQGSDVRPGLVEKGSFKVDEVEHSGPPDIVTIRARSADFTSDLRVRRETTHHDRTLGTIVGEIAGRNGLQPRCAPRLAGVVLKMTAQSRESDMAFLRRLGREHDAVATIKRGALIFAPIGAGVTTKGAALPSLRILRRDGDRHSFRIEKRDNVEGVQADWHDRGEAKRKTVTVGKANSARKLSRTYATEEDARRAAASAKGRAARQPVSLSLSLALGRPDIYPEQKATVAGFKAPIDAVAWLVGEVTHSLGSQGYVTALKLETSN
ncbi:contractile injection system protein, VgrG/Pvc8 family [Sphingomonas hylomeconis]|uniref:Contractile injection system protein, VgrG/Pvc8 family n=1 Tax=Sphingomonas hylomeconis TaxID=1395958 RepID=A0ABV7SW30_9SPHN|nr:contractile injection system protein, VgrG/Pvc8 family [Sphingomonas hylomeconis]